MFFDGLTDGAEDDALFGQFFLVGGLHRNGVHDGIHGGLSAEDESFFQRNAQFLEGFHHFGVNLFFLLVLFLGHGVGII